MQPNMIWANLSVKDAARSHRFYSTLGFAPNGTHGTEKLASFRFGEQGFVIHFFEEGSQIDEYLRPAGSSTSEIMFTLSATSEEEVAAWADAVRNAGGTLLSEPRRDANGYYGFAFTDPDGHKFNVLLMEEGM